MGSGRTAPSFLFINADDELTEVVVSAKKDQLAFIKMKLREDNAAISGNLRHSFNHNAKLCMYLPVSKFIHVDLDF